MMQADFKNKRQFFKTIKNIRGGKCSNTPGSLITPTGSYHGTDILEGFTADAELLGQHVGEAPEFDNSFYKLCILDNMYIFDFLIIVQVVTNLTVCRTAAAANIECRRKPMQSSVLHSVRVR